MNTLRDYFLLKKKSLIFNLRSHYSILNQQADTKVSQESNKHLTL